MSSISDAIARLRPDLNRQTKFQRGETSGITEKPAADLADDQSLYIPGDDLPLPVVRTGFWDHFLGGVFSSGRSRLLAGLLGALTLVLGIGFFPSVGPVRGKSGAQVASIAEAGGATLPAAASAEIDKLEQKLKPDPAAAVPVPTPESRPSPPKPEPEVVATLNVRTKPAPEKPIQIQLQLRRPQPTTATFGQPLHVADSLPLGEAVALASITGGAVELADEPLEIADARHPGAEVLYEAMPSPEIGDEPPAGERSRTGRKSSGTPAAAPRPEFSLSGIFWDKTNPMAMINGEIYEVGQTVAGAKILEIKPESVTVERNGRLQSLTL